MWQDIVGLTHGEGSKTGITTTFDSKAGIQDEAHISHQETVETDQHTEQRNDITSDEAQP